MSKSCPEYDFDGTKGADRLCVDFFYVNDPHKHRDMALTKKINPNCPSLREWVRANLQSLSLV